MGPLDSCQLPQQPRQIGWQAAVSGSGVDRQQGGDAWCITNCAIQSGYDSLAEGQPSDRQVFLWVRISCSLIQFPCDKARSHLVSDARRDHQAQNLEPLPGDSAGFLLEFSPGGFQRKCQRRLDSDPL